jgi:hypothetical protein
LKLSVTFAVIDERIRIGITPLIALATGVGHRYILIFWVNLTISAHIIIFVRAIAGFCVQKSSAIFSTLTAGDLSPSSFASPPTITLCLFNFANILDRFSVP